MKRFLILPGFYLFRFNCEHFLFVSVVKQNKIKFSDFRKKIHGFSKWKSSFVGGKYLRSGKSD